MDSITINRLADLRIGDRIKSWDGHAYNPPRIVTTTLGPIEAGSPVQGVRLANPNPDSTLEYVLYPSQMDSRTLGVDRP